MHATTCREREILLWKLFRIFWLVLGAGTQTKETKWKNLHRSRHGEIAWPHRRLNYGKRPTPARGNSSRGLSRFQIQWRECGALPVPHAGSRERILQSLDDRTKPPRPDPVAKAIIPDVLLGAHVAPLQFAFYTGQQFPPEYRHGAFIAEHGSWNHSILSGYAVVFVPFPNGRPTAAPTPFLTGFLSDPKAKSANGRPVGVAVAKDGSLLVSDDGGKVIWRVSKAEPIRELVNLQEGTWEGQALPSQAVACPRRTV